MTAREFLGLRPTHNPHRWVLPVERGICVRHAGFLFGGCGLGAAVTARLRLGSARRAVRQHADEPFLRHRRDADAIATVERAVAEPAAGPRPAAPPLARRPR